MIFISLGLQGRQVQHEMIKIQKIAKKKVLRKVDFRECQGVYRQSQVITSDSLAARGGSWFGISHRRSPTIETTCATPNVPRPTAIAWPPDHHFAETDTREACPERFTGRLSKGKSLEYRWKRCAPFAIQYLTCSWQNRYRRAATIEVPWGARDDHRFRRESVGQFASETENGFIRSRHERTSRFVCWSHWRRVIFKLGITGCSLLTSFLSDTALVLE